MPTDGRDPGAPAAPLRQLAELPGPAGWPLVGNLLQLEPARMHLQLAQWASTYGRFFRLRMGPTTVLVAADHAAVAAALRERPDGFRRTLRQQRIALEMGMKPGLFGAEGDAWRRQRRMVMAAFDPGHVSAYYPSLVRCGERLATLWHKAAASGRAVDLQADLMRFTVDAIAGLAFGTDVNTLGSDENIIQRHLDKIFPKLFTRIISPLPYWRWFKLPSDKALDVALVEVNRAIDGFIAAARERLADPARRAAPQNLLEAMIVAADEPGSGITDDQVSGNVMTMLLAGEDTTANTLAWAIWLLARHPEALARAQGEVRRVMAGGGPVTQEALAQLDYVEACMHETMRLRPVAPLLGLEALKDGVVGDVAVPTGTMVMALMRHDSIDDQHVPEAKLFKPERWLGEGGYSPASAKRVSMPFGAGPRMCPGRYLALQEMKMVMVTLLDNFELASVGTEDGSEPAERLMFAMAPVGLRMTLRAA
ncbi:cytochrome P450 [Ramlibacter sp. GTP1]|uniref:Cytochrome P450 n=2 Tax=Ramlibacter albus TaxID=2079448 RepID=A0A923MFZ3_9BURK|nr:cytochrome P450 [Ramlibacter albus]